MPVSCEAERVRRDIKVYEERMAKERVVETGAASNHGGTVSQLEASRLLPAEQSRAGVRGV